MHEQYPFDRPLAFVDLETSGSRIEADRITEVGIVTVDTGGAVSEWSTLVNPGMRIPSFIETLTGISDAMVEDAPPFEHVAEDIARRLEGRLFIAHNVRFDYGFLRREFARIGRPFRPALLCTAKLSRRLFPQYARHNLDALMERHGLQCAARHRALGDAQVLWQFAQVLKDEVDPAVIAAAAQAQSKTVRLAPDVPREALEELPGERGVYALFDRQGEALCVGRAPNLYEGVLARLARSASLAGRFFRADWRFCNGELGARLMEARWVRELAPARHRRSSGSCHAWQWRPGADPPRLVRADMLDAQRLDEAFLLSGSAEQAIKGLAGLARAYRLCPALLGLPDEAQLSQNPTGRACKAHLAGLCAGACCGRETPGMHALRLMTALAPARLQPWPFRGAIGIREGCRGHSSDGWDEAEIQVFRDWRHLGEARDEAELQALLEQAVPRAFDAENYSLLRRFLARRPAGSELLEFHRGA
jgi:DNA polymerase-3 subunit epsilon